MRHRRRSWWGSSRAFLARSIVNATARVGRHSRANTVRAKAPALSVRRWRWGVHTRPQRGTAPVRCTAYGYGISMTGALPTCPMCRKRAWERIPEPTPSPNRGRSRERHDALVRRGEGLRFILTEAGERNSVHRSGFLPGEVPVGPCARHAARLTATGTKRQARCHRRVDGSGGSAGTVATAQLERSLRVGVMCR